jgi:hypothetical protein
MKIFLLTQEKWSSTLMLLWNASVKERKNKFIFHLFPGNFIFSTNFYKHLYLSNCVMIFRLIHINKESWRGQCFLIYQHFSSFAEPQSMYQEYKQGLQPLRLRLKIMLDTSKILLLKSKFNSSIRKIEITYYNSSVRAFYLQHIRNMSEQRIRHSRTS